MGISAFLPAPLSTRAPTHLPRIPCFTKTRPLQTCGTTAVAPSTDLRNSAQFLRHHWRNAITRTCTHTRTLVAIDATAGRGSDTLTLGQYLGLTGIVHAFDIQNSAIEETRARYIQASETNSMAQLHLHNASHADFSFLGLPPASVSIAAYNLGWYPARHADRSLVTTVDTTLSSLASAETLLSIGGLISVMAYVGHPGGKEEEQAVIDWSASLCKKQWSVALVTYPNRENAPSLLLCERVS